MVCTERLGITLPSLNHFFQCCLHCRPTNNRDNGRALSQISLRERNAKWLLVHWISLPATTFTCTETVLTDSPLGYTFLQREDIFWLTLSYDLTFIQHNHSVTHHQEWRFMWADQHWSFSGILWSALEELYLSLIIKCAIGHPRSQFRTAIQCSRYCHSLSLASWK